MNYQNILDRLAKQEPLKASDSWNHYVSKQSTYVGAKTSRNQDNINSNTQFERENMRPTNYIENSQNKPEWTEAPKDRNRTILDIGSYYSTTNESGINNAKFTSKGSSCSFQSLDRGLSHGSTGNISAKNSRVQKGSQFLPSEMPSSFIAGNVGKYSSPAKRKTLDENSLSKSHDYERLFQSAKLSNSQKQKDFNPKTEDSSVKNTRQYSSTKIRQLGVELQKSLFRKDSLKVSSRDSSKSSCRGHEQKQSHPQVSAFSGKRHSSNIQADTLSKADFQIGKCKGDGKFGKVYPCRHKLTGTLYALKQIPKELVTRHMMEDQMVREIKLHSFFNHNNIVKLYGYFSDATMIYLLMEYMEDGALYNVFKKSKKLSEEYVAERIKEITSALSYLHDLEVAHRDIKLENIVLSNGVAKLCDFGWAAPTDCRRTTYCGTFDYAPPEIVQGKEYNHKVDLWSLGVMTYEMLVGQVPFYNISRSETMNNIVNIDKKPISYPANISENAKDFINSILKKDPAARTSAKVLLNHAFLASVKEYLI